MKPSDNQAARVGLCTLGCKVSQYETEALGEAFTAAGFTVLPFDTPCDVYVINTCTVTAESDRKSRQMIRRAIKGNPHAVVMVTGCSAQAHPDALAAIPGVTYVCGNESKMQIPARAAALLRDSVRTVPIPEFLDVQGAPFEPMCVKSAPRTRAYVKIEDGCECRCTYCAIPGARGRVRSKPPGDVIREVATLAAGGTREVVLTGIETAAYGADLDGCTLTDLLEELDETRAVPRLRLGSMAPEFFRPETVTRLARLRCLTPHLHLSVQSGATAVLARMKRRYNGEQAAEIIRSLREAIPELELTGDFIVGFPGETDEDFAETAALVRDAGFLDIHVFVFSPREGTPAADFTDRVPDHICRARSRTLIRTGAESRRKRLALAAAANTQTVLFEQREGNFFVGHTPAFVPVAVQTDADLHGVVATVVHLTAQDDRLMGELLPG